MRSTFRSLRHRNYRLWAAGALVSNIGTWMQRTAQDWIVLTQLTHNDATAVGIVMSLQFGPQLALMSVAGSLADRMDRRRILLATQALMGLLALVLGLLAITGTILLWHVYALALLLGCVTAFDAPARQTFVSDLVGERDLANAVALNATSFHSARLVGPAVAGVLVAAVGAGWAFVLNAVSFGAVLLALACLRTRELHARPPGSGTATDFRAGLGYVARRPDLLAVMLMMFLVSTFGLNFAIFIPAMAAEVYRVGPQEFGALASLMGVGSVAGALYSARQEQPRLAMVLGGAAVFGIGSAICALAPGVAFFGLALALTGVAAQVYMTSTNGLVQVSSDPAMRGRVMAILLAIINGCTPLGAPVVGWIADVFGPRWALGAASASGFVAALIGIRYWLKGRQR